MFKFQQKVSGQFFELCLSRLEHIRNVQWCLDLLKYAVPFNRISVECRQLKPFRFRALWWEKRQVLVLFILWAFYLMTINDLIFFFEIDLGSLEDQGRARLILLPSILLRQTDVLQNISRSWSWIGWILTKVALKIQKTTSCVLCLHLIPVE